MVSGESIMNFEEFFPYYGIELDRFMKVIRYAEIPLTRDDIV